MRRQPAGWKHPAGGGLTAATRLARFEAVPNLCPRSVVMCWTGEPAASECAKMGPGNSVNALP
jgi:hypothetical protein